METPHWNVRHAETYDTPKRTARRNGGHAET